MKIKNIKKKIDKLIKQFELELDMLEIETDTDIYYFPYMTVIEKNCKQHIFMRTKQRRIR